MKISRNWLQIFFDAPLPDAGKIDEALTFHALEIDGVTDIGEDSQIDVKITANRAHDCMSHRGIAKELSAILDVPMKDDPLATLPAAPEPRTEKIALATDSKANPLHVLCLIENVKVGPSPKWLVDRLATVGQRSINNVVDATNYVMLGLGQPTHVFDWDKLSEKNGTRGIRTRFSKTDEPITLLGGVEKTLPEGVLVLADFHDDAPLDVAAIKGGQHAELSDNTKNVLVTAAAFDPILIRKTSQKIKLRTDASHRFENNPPHVLPLAAAPMVAKLIVELAGGTIQGHAIEGSTSMSERSVSVALSHINALLGVEFSAAEVSDAFRRLGFAFTDKDDVFTVTVPFMRSDITIPEDLIEEAGRILGYDRVAPKALPNDSAPSDRNETYVASDALREALLQMGMSEVHTSVFATKGERAVMNKVESDTPFLRTNLFENLSAALEKNILVKDVVGVRRVLLFEVGTVWKDGKEYVSVGVAAEKQKKQPTAALLLQEALASVGIHATLAGDIVAEFSLEGVKASIDGQLAVSTAGKYKPFSKYPFISRDIAVWCPAGTDSEALLLEILKHAGDLVVHSELFDRFEKEGRVSFAFRLVFQSFDRTLMDEEVTPRMDAVYAFLKEKGYEIR